MKIKNKNKNYFSAKRKRQFRHILVSELKTGKSPDIAKRIAGATVNKTRREKGELKKKSEVKHGKSKNKI